MELCLPSYRRRKAYRKEIGRSPVDKPCYMYASCAAGERASFPVVLCVVMPLSLLVVFSGVLIRKIKRNKLLELVSVSAEKNPRASGQANRLLGILLIAAGRVSAALSAALSCLLPQLCYLSAIVLACGVLISLAASLIFARVWAGKELQEAEGDKEQI